MRAGKREGAYYLIGGAVVSILWFATGVSGDFEFAVTGLAATAVFELALIAAVICKHCASDARAGD